MPASAGTPTIWEKIAALWGGDGAENAAVLAGDKADLAKGVAALQGLFGPVVNEIETDALTDVTGFLKGLAAAAPTFTSLSQAVNYVKGSAAALGGPVGQQVGSLSQSALITLVSAALVAVGKLNVPVA